MLLTNLRTKKSILGLYRNVQDSTVSTEQNVCCGSVRLLVMNDHAMLQALEIYRFKAST